MDKSYKILIVDDNIDLASNLQDIFTEEGYGTEVAHDGQTALALCRDIRPELIIVDFRLPDITGLDLINKLVDISSDFLFIVITGYASIDSAINAVKQKNIIAYETKPLDTERFLSLVRQILERKQAENNLKESEEKRRELERKAQQVSRLASVGQMASGIAHEINNPLTGVVGFSKILVDNGGWPEEVQTQLEIINTGANRITEVVKRLLTFARQQKPERKLADINEVIETCLSLRKYELDTGNINLIRHLDPELPMSVIDAGQLQDVFMNIIVNAEKAMRQAHEGGKLNIRTEVTDDIIRVSITDDGPGIAEENLDKIFNPFFTTREVGEGTGLGLSLSYGIIQEHHGKIYVESKPGRGATFIVELPIIAAAKEEGRPVELVEEIKTNTKTKILVIDDEPTVLLLLKEFLIREGHEVETADNCQDALERARVNRYGLILCDVMMPGMSGVQLYRAVMEEIPSLARRFIFITGDTIGMETSHFLSETGLPCMNKPFDLVEVKNTINHSLAAVGW